MLKKIQVFFLIFFTAAFSQSCTEDPVNPGDELKDIVFTYGNNTNYSYVLGCGDQQVDMPYRITGLNDAIIVDASMYHSIALTSNGKVFVWGSNNRSNLAIDPEIVDHLAYPQQVEGIPEIKKISSSDYCTLALDYLNHVWAWGRIGYSESHIPDKLDLSNIVDISCGRYHCLAVDSAGQMYAWGYNSYGQLGIGSKVSQGYPVPIVIPDKIVNVFAGNNVSYAITEEGTLLAWGDNSAGQLGMDVYSGLMEPAIVPVEKRVVDLALGYQHCICLVEGGDLYSWGANLNGSLGIETENSNVYIPALIPYIHDVEMIDASMYSSLARTNDGTLWSWGISISNSSTPDRVRFTNYLLPEILTVLDGSPSCFATGGEHLIYISD